MGAVMSIGKLRAELRAREFFSVPEAAKLLGKDVRTVRRACERDPRHGGIPATRIGVRWVIPTSWLRHQVSGRQENDDGRAA